MRAGTITWRSSRARRFRRWRTVSFAGLVCGDRRALVLVSHEGVERRQLLDVMRPRWADRAGAWPVAAMMEPMVTPPTDVVTLAATA